MDDLIEALTIFKKYLKPGSFQYDYPTHCEHDVLMVCVYKDVSEEDSEKLNTLGFSLSEEYSCWVSHKFGSS